MATCNKLKKGFLMDCNRPPKEGIRDEAIIIHKSELLEPVRDADYKKRVLGLPRTTGSVGFKIEGINNSLNNTNSISQLQLGTRYTQTFNFLATGTDPESIEALEDLNGNRFAVVYPDENGYYRIMGLGAGLKATENTNDQNNAETGGGYQVTLQSEKENGFPDFLWAEDVTDPANPIYDPVAVKALYDALLVAAA